MPILGRIDILASKNFRERVIIWTLCPDPFHGVNYLVHVTLGKKLLHPSQNAIGTSTHARCCPNSSTLNPASFCNPACPWTKRRNIFPTVLICRRLVAIQDASFCEKDGAVANADEIPKGFTAIEAMESSTNEFDMSIYLQLRPREKRVDRPDTSSHNQVVQVRSWLICMCWHIELWAKEFAIRCVRGGFGQH